MTANTEPQKYARSLHAPISLGTTSDDRFMPRGYLAHFATLPQLVLTEKCASHILRYSAEFSKSSVCVPVLFISPLSKTII